MNIELWNTGAAPASFTWPIGEVRHLGHGVDQINDAVEQLDRKTVDFVLLWDPALGEPDPIEVARLAEEPGDCWHAGLKLGTAGLPQLLDAVAPIWMFNRDPDPGIPATSWRLTPRACLIRAAILEPAGPLDRNFSSLDAAMLEFGHRLISAGALLRHHPPLVKKNDALLDPPSLTLEDELRFVRNRYGRKWVSWASLRAIAWNLGNTLEVMRAQAAAHLGPPALRSAKLRESGAAGERTISGNVTVLIPTLHRYPYLRTLLEQLRVQTVPAREIIVVDQTAPDERLPSLYEEFPDLPLRVFFRDQPGQCTSRNEGLRASRGDFILFLDDDDEVPPDLIERHLVNLTTSRADVSSGVAHEVGVDDLPEAFRRVRASDVFPTNNTMVRRGVLERSGLFDLAFDRAKRADGDLGMRVYLSGSLMVFNGDVFVKHHHAPLGGLREHNARVVTHAQSRRDLLVAHVPSTSEIYLAMRYFSPRQVDEMIWMRTCGTLRLKGSVGKQVAKIAVGTTRLPSVIRRVRERREEAQVWLTKYPVIPNLEAQSSCT